MRNGRRNMTNVSASRTKFQEKIKKQTERDRDRKKEKFTMNHRMEENGSG